MAEWYAHFFLLERRFSLRKAGEQIVPFTAAKLLGTAESAPAAARLIVELMVNWELFFVCRYPLAGPAALKLLLETVLAGKPE